VNAKHPFELSAPVSGVDHALGPEHAHVTIVEYGDFECPNCKQAAPAVKLLLERFPERARLIFRHFPLIEVHPHALMAAEAAECAGAQGQFWPMHDLLFDNQLHLKANQLRAYAQRLPIDMARYTAEMDDQVYLQRIREHQQSAHDSGVRGTPTFFVNGRLQDVSFGMQGLFGAVEAALKR
jgi:protein-disulfide isomerase